MRITAFAPLVIPLHPSAPISASPQSKITNPNSKIAIPTRSHFRYARPMKKTMKQTSCLAALLLLAAIMAATTATTAHAQVVPTTPKSFQKRGVGDAFNTANVNVTPAPTPPTIIRTVTYYSLSDSRQWNSADGKALVGKLIAFEEHVVETVKGAPEPPTPAPTALPSPPTVIRDGKVRLLVNNQPYELPLTRLSKDDQEFINVAKIGASKPAAP